MTTPFEFKKHLWAAQAAGVPVGLPTKGLVFHCQLDQWNTKSNSGHMLRYSGRSSSAVTPTATVYKGIPCCQFGADCLWDVAYVAKAGAKAYVGSLSCWVASNQSLVKWKGTAGIVCLRGPKVGAQRYGVEWQNDQSNLSAGVHNNNTVYDTYTSISNNTRWHHYYIELDVPATAASSTDATWHHSLYLDGTKVRESNLTSPNYELNYIQFGQYRNSDSYVFSIAAIRVYNRKLRQHEITALANEFEPTT